MQRLGENDKLRPWLVEGELYNGRWAPGPDSVASPQPVCCVKCCNREACMTSSAMHGLALRMWWRSQAGNDCHCGHAVGGGGRTWTLGIRSCQGDSRACCITGVLMHTMLHQVMDICACIFNTASVLECSSEFCLGGSEQLCMYGTCSYQCTHACSVEFVSRVQFHAAMCQELRRASV